MQGISRGARLRRRAVQALAGVIGALISATVLPASDDRADLENLFARWQARATEIATARVHYRSFHNSVEGRRTLPELDVFLAEGLLDSSHEGFRAFINAMNGDPYPIDPPWGQGTILARDSSQRNDLGPFTTIEDRNLCVDYDTLNRQFDVSNPGRSRKRSDSLLLFRPVPPEPWTLASWQIAGRGGDGLTLRRVLPGSSPDGPLVDDRVYVVDPATGMITRVTRTNAQGQVVSFARYLELSELPGSIVAPRIVVEGTLRDGVIHVLHVCAIDRITVNEPVQEHEFEIPARANSRIVDHRGPQKQVSRLDVEQADLVTWLKSHAPATGPNPQTPNSPDQTTRNMLLTGNGLLLVVVGIVFWKRQRPLSATSSSP